GTSCRSSRRITHGRRMPGSEIDKSDVPKNAVERSRHAHGVERLDEVARVARLAAAAAAHEPAQLLVHRPAPPLGLLLQRAEGAEIPFRLDDALDRVDPECADQLVLEVGLADVEAERLHVRARQRRAEAGALEAAAEVALLAGVAESGEREIETA